MYHETHGADNRQDNFWTDISEGSDLLPGMMPGGMPMEQLDDRYPTGHHAVQQEEYGTGIDPHGDNLAMPGDDPEQMPKYLGRGDGSGMADWDGTGETEASDRLPGNYGRTAAQTEQSNPADQAQDSTQDATQDCDR